MEQPELGSALVACDSITIGLEFRWESGWAVRYSARLSGSETWQTVRCDSLDEAEVHAQISDLLACTLGLV